jgi:hypothetical protein
MRQLSLHSNQNRILDALRSALGILRMTNNAAIIGSLARHLAGDPTPPGDIDVLIERPLCERYWAFLEILAQHKIYSVRDVLDRPLFSWRSCIAEIGHARSLAIDCMPDKHNGLDICFKASDLASIPHSERWVLSLASGLIATAKEEAVREGHQEFLNYLRQQERLLSSPVWSNELGLYYRLGQG